MGDRDKRRGLTLPTGITHSQPSRLAISSFTAAVDAPVEFVFASAVGEHVASASIETSGDAGGGEGGGDEGEQEEDEGGKEGC